MNSTQFQEDCSIYTKWLSNNFHEEVNTNPFKTEYEDDMDILHEYDLYDYLIPQNEELPPDFYENGMFDGPPNIGIYFDDEEDDVYDNTDYM
jgi:hypothetical protein